MDLRCSFDFDAERRANAVSSAMSWKRRRTSSMTSRVSSQSKRSTSLGDEVFEEEEDDDTGTNDSSATFSMDEAISHMGMGWFQYKMLVFTGMIFAADAMELMLLAFLVPKLENEWGLEKPKDGLIAAAVFAGMLCGVAFWSIVGDRFGRKIVVQLCSLLFAVFGTLSALAPDIWTLIVFRFGVGFCVGGAPVSYSLFAEVLPVNDRGAHLMFEQMLFAFGGILSVVLAWISLTQLNWRWYLGFCAAPLWLLSIFSFSIVESPRYLLSKGRTEEAMQVLSQISRENGKDLPRGTLSQPMFENPEKIETLVDVFHVAFGRTSPLLYFLFVVIVFVYYGIAFISERYFTETSGDGHASDRFWKMLITASAEIPANLFGYYYLDTFGRKNFLIWTNFVYSACAFLMIFKVVHKLKMLGLVLVFVARLCASQAFCTLFVYYSEFYPTSIRTTALGLASSLGRISGMATSFVANDLPMTASMGLYAAAAFVGGICAVALPFDTTDMPLLDSIEEFKLCPHFKKKTKKTTETTGAHTKLINN